MGWFWNSKNPVKPADPEVFSNRSLPGSESEATGFFWAASSDSKSANAMKSALVTKSRNEQAGPSEGLANVTDTAKGPGAAGNEPNSASKCPVDHTKLMKGKKPVADQAQVSPPSTQSSGSGCPVDHTTLGRSGSQTDHINPLNNMPRLSDSKVPGQTIDLPTERTVSSIPRGSAAGAGNWEYPSPQQMMNAMVRKSGREGIEEDAVESMVDVHNFLNEGVWNEVLEWETPYTEASKVTPRLLKFTGRPNDMSPRARMLQALGSVYPSKFGFPPPFDRHDWTVLRMTPSGDWQPVRYVIDFYEAPDEGDMPAFSVDVRPALDSYQSAVDRIKRSAGPAWDKALGRA